MSSSSSEQPKKWKRASAPKVRTGCLTCKIRHLKCDERKPTCQRCEKDRVKCDGYPANPPPRPKKEPRPSQRCKALTAPSKTNGGRLLVNSGLGGNVSTLPFQIDLFHHFRTSTLHDLNMVPGSSSDFWHVHVLPLGHAVEPVKYALCALGGVHRYFKTQHGNPHAMLEWRELDKIVIQQYNQAIHHIKSLMTDASESNLEVVLTCCIIFICIENLQGRYKEALRHIRAGSALLNALRQSYTDPGSPSDSGSGTSSTPSPTPGRRVPKFVDEIGEMLFNLGQDVSFYVGTEVVPTLTCRDISTLPDQYSAAVQFPSAPINSFDMAVSSLRAMEVMDNTIRYHLFEENPPPGEPRKRDWEEMIREPNAYEQMLWDVFEQTMQDWIGRFDSFKSQIDRTRITEREREHLQSLSLSRAVWWSFLNDEGPEDEMPRDEAEEILNSVESLMGPARPDQQPIFTFNSEIIPPTCVVCMSCQDRDIQQRAVRLLRTMKRREGMWDSEEMANVFEAMMAASKKGLMEFRDIPCEIPQLTKALSALSVTETPLSREIISLEDE